MNLPLLFQRIEGGSIFLATLYFFATLHGNWLWFVIIWLAIDLSMLGYTVNNKVGAYLYNLGHVVIGPVIFMVIGAATKNTLALQLSAIWFAHIGLDRLLGYGLKEETGFAHTHLGIIGPKKK